MTEPQSAQSAQGGGSREAAPRPRRPASLSFEPAATVEDPEHFFDLESMDDPGRMLARATELATAFRTAADRATDFQAIAAAQLTDPRRFDRLTYAVLAERAGWTEDYAKRMAEYGEGLIAGGAAS
ncbi:hypothetical protein [Streptomyces sp. CBMA29]|uniref:hypothetical protein n=1 Tax=Streptomyces sp. CBMA29 TaxID=1896314 RepID=UPI001661BF7D|nr:hypothetical protein [Streptomyces sp. CBMA29]MBD0738150.1 hypothetical protein [Streptomyces sp. CBMA29]